MVIFYKNWKKHNEIQLTKNKMDLNIREMTNHPPSPGYNSSKYVGTKQCRLNTPFITNKIMHFLLKKCLINAINNNKMQINVTYNYKITINAIYNF